MPFEIVRNDIVSMQVDAIVSAASHRPVIGYGVETGIHRKAGPGLLAARQRIGELRTGDAAITPGFDLQAKYVIHAVSPVWRGGEYGEEQLLRSCYTRSLMLAKRHRCESIAFPLLAAGNHGFPKPLALQAAMGAISDFLMKNDMMVYLVVFSRDAFQLSEKLFQGVSSYIDEHYVQEKSLREYGLNPPCGTADFREALHTRQQLRKVQAMEECARFDEPFMPEMMPAPAPKKAAPRPFSVAKPKPSLAQLLEQTDAGFSETLLKLIDQTGKKDSVIYTRANVSRQHFSKIRNNPDYKPTKATAIAFAIALELDLEQTRDLIGRAGFALTNSNKFDVIIMYFIRERNYNMMDINAALFEFDQSLLGA